MIEYAGMTVKISNAANLAVIGAVVCAISDTIIPLLLAVQFDFVAVTLVD